MILVISVASRDGGALITIAFADGSPSSLATWSETTASTPPMPTVPNPATGSVSVRDPVTWTGLVSWSLACLPIVYEIAMPPAAMFCHSVAERAVGLAANGRNADGFTPSTFTKTPFDLDPAGVDGHRGDHAGQFADAARAGWPGVPRGHHQQVGWSSRFSVGNAEPARIGQRLSGDRRGAGRPGTCWLPGTGRATRDCPDRCADPGFPHCLQTPRSSSGQRRAVHAVLMPQGLRRPGLPEIPRSAIKPSTRQKREHREQATRPAAHLASLQLGGRSSVTGIMPGSPHAWKRAPGRLRHSRKQSLLSHPIAAS